MAADADEPVEDVAAEDLAEQENLHPFFTVSATGGVNCTIQAGWMTDENEVEMLVLDFSGNVGMAEQAIMAAYQWYIGTASAIMEETIDAG